VDKRLQQPKDVARCLTALLIALAASNSVVVAAPSNQARLTDVINDVRLVGSDGVPRRISRKQELASGYTLQTGIASRAELIFADETVARCAANTVFGFDNGTGKLNLNGGAVLLQVPKTAKSVRVQADGVVANITGTTVMLEHYPGMYKFLVLEGKSRLYRPGHFGDSILVQPGQMVIGNPQSAVSDPVDVDIGRFFKTSQFIRDFSPLRTEGLIIAESERQQRQKSKKRLLDTNLVIFGGGTQVSLMDPVQSREQPSAPQPAAPAATPPSVSTGTSISESKSQPH
jgi:hypothetical protein